MTPVLYSVQSDGGQTIAEGLSLEELQSAVANGVIQPHWLAQEGGVGAWMVVKHCIKDMPPLPPPADPPVRQQAAPPTRPSIPSLRPPVEELELKPDRGPIYHVTREEMEARARTTCSGSSA